MSERRGEERRERERAFISVTKVIYELWTICIGIVCLEVYSHSVLYNLISSTLTTEICGMK